MQKDVNLSNESELLNNNNDLAKHIKKGKKTKKKKIKSYIGRVLAHKKEKPLPVTILALLIAFILDILRIIKNLIVSLFVVILICGIAVVIIALIKIEPIYKEYNEFATNIVENSTYDDFKLTESSYVYDSDGNVLAKLKADIDSEYLKYEDIPCEVIDAFVAVEDRTFWDNPGIDIKGLIRVGLDAVKTKGEEVHGASTITQQLSRNIYLTHEVSLERKAKEMLIALKLTDKYTKEDIIEFYCNDICFANTYYGIQAASRGYFNKDVNELSLSQIAYLCAIPNSPEYYNPYKNPERALERRDKILGDMLELGFITKTDYNKAINEEIIIEQPTYEFNDYMTTYAVDCATQYLMEMNNFEFKYKFEDMDEYNEYNEKYLEEYALAKNQLYSGGYKVYTSLDSNVQSNLQEILDSQLNFDEEINEATGIYELQGAITAYDNYTGKVIAVIGGRSQETDSKTYSLNRAYQSYRQPGSTIKPLVVYTTALMNGYTPNSVVYNINVSEAKKKGVDVQSLTGDMMTLRSALEQSKNGVAWQLFDKFGANTCMTPLNEMRFSQICPDDYFNAAALGGLTYGVSTVEMAGAYATLENHGTYRQTTCIVSILDRDGNDIYVEPEEIQVYTARAADTMVDMMKGVLTNGTAAKLGWYRSTDMVAACKTGTTNGCKDGWLCGFTPYYTVAVWVGYDKPRVMNNLYGSTYPGNIWKESMLSLIEYEDIITDFEQADYELYGEDEEEFMMVDDLPEYAYEMYLAGRDDSEELSSGYTVYDYRKDRVIGESVQEVISNIYNLPQGDSQLDTLYNQGCAIINTIYSRKYTAEMQSQLDTAYNSKK